VGAEEIQGGERSGLAGGGWDGEACYLRWGGGGEGVGDSGLYAVEEGVWL